MMDSSRSDYQNPLRKQVLKAINLRSTKKRAEIRALMVQAANDEVEQFFKIVARDFMGTSEMPHELSEFTEAWWPLTKKYAEKKGNSLFFVKTHEMVREMGDLSGMAILGATTFRMDYDNSSGASEGLTNEAGYAASASKITIRPFAAFTANFPLDGIGADDGMAHLVGSHLLNGYNKLMNSQHDRQGNPTPAPVRALLLPALLFFMKYRIPAAIRKVLFANGYTVKA